MLDVRNRRLAALPALALGLLLFAPSASSAGHGLGRMTVTPTRVLAGSAGNTLAFAYVADTRAFRGEMLVDVARGWSTPQTTSAMAPGYVRVAHGTCSNRTRLLR